MINKWVDGEKGLSGAGHGNDSTAAMILKILPQGRRRMNDSNISLFGSVCWGGDYGPVAGMAAGNRLLKKH